MRNITKGANLIAIVTADATPITASVDKFLLARFMGSASVSVYDVGAKFNTYLAMFSLTVSNVFVPRVNNIVAENGGNGELTELMTRVGRIQLYVTVLVFGGFVLVGRYFIGLYAGDGYGLRRAFSPFQAEYPPLRRFCSAQGTSYKP